MIDSEYEDQAISVEDALKHILSSTKPVTRTEPIEVENSLSRVCAKNYTSKINLPTHRCSAMDGYATHTNFCQQLPADLKIIGQSLPGKPYTGPNIKAGECIKIITGALIPEQVDAVIMSEQIESNNHHIKVNLKPKQGQHIRQIGGDIAQDAIIISKGKRITPPDMALLYACGINTVEVYNLPIVNFLTVGDELKDINQILDAGEIYNSNAAGLKGMLNQAKCKINNLGIVQDKQAALDEVFINAQKNTDCIITVGNVTIDSANHIKKLLIKNGKTDFWRVSVKPGRPLTFGQLHNQILFFGLPNNPVSLMATFYLFVLPALKKLSGEKHAAPLRLQAICTDKITKLAGRTDYQRGNLYNDENNKLYVSVSGNQQSHVMSSMSKANCFIELARESTNQQAGSLVTVIPFSGLI